MRRSLLPLIVVCSLLFAGCGASGGDKTSSSDGSSNETTAPDPSGSDDSSTTAADSGDDEPATFTSAQLEAILPEASDIGPNYTVKESADDEADDGSDDESTTTEAGSDEAKDPTEAALEEQCPKAAELDFLDDTDDPDEVSVEFETPQDQTIEVSLTPTAPLDEDQLDQVIEAFNDCGTISIDDEDIGTMTMDLSAEPLEGIGDYGANITMSAGFELFGTEVNIDFTGYLFAVDGVGVTVTAASGLDPNTMEPTPADTDLLPDLAAEMESRVQSLS